ncbi:MAG: NUDIX hydrolase [Bacillota bacterium]|nr:NUDIX hydrolase [Bacillota bacterium]
MINPFTLTSGAVIRDNKNKILLKKDPSRGWELPGGIVEANETIEDAVIREVKEETGLDIEVLKFCGVSQELRKNICNFWWLGKPLNGNLMTSDESLDVGFFSLEEALKLITMTEYRQELLKVIDIKNQPFLITFD